MKTTTLVSTFLSDDGSKHAEVHHDPEYGLSVYLYNNSKLVGKKDLHNYSINHAEDCAESYISNSMSSKQYLTE